MAFSWFFRGFFVALFCLEKQCSGLFRYFFVTFSWLFRGPRFGQILRVLALEQSSDQKCTPEGFSRECSQQSGCSPECSLLIVHHTEDSSRALSGALLGALLGISLIWPSGSQRRGDLTRCPHKENWEEKLGCCKWGCNKWGA